MIAPCTNCRRLFRGEIVCPFCAEPAAKHTRTAPFAMAMAAAAVLIGCPSPDPMPLVVPATTVPASIEPHPVVRDSNDVPQARPTPTAAPTTTTTPRDEQQMVVMYGAPPMPQPSSTAKPSPRLAPTATTLPKPSPNVQPPPAPAYGGPPPGRSPKTP
jgi:hypothetical protein